MHDIFQEKLELETYDYSLKAFTSSFEATPCSFAAAHHVKGVNIKVAGENAFAEVQNKLNVLAENCAKEMSTEAKIAALEAAIKDAENKIAQSQAALPEQKTKKEEYEAANKEVTDAACSEAASKTGTMASAGRGVSDFFGTIGHHMGGWGKSADQKEAREKERKAKQEAEEAELTKQKNLAEKCEVRKAFIKEISKNDKVLQDQAVRKVKDEAELVKQKTALNEAKVAIKTNIAGVLSELEALQASVNDSFRSATQATNDEEPLSREEPLSQSSSVEAPPVGEESLTTLPLVVEETQESLTTLPLVVEETTQGPSPSGSV